MKKASIFITLVFVALSNCLIAQQISLSTIPSTTRPISDFYGLNGQNALTTTSNYANPNVRTGLIASKASYLRFPGGTLANFWDWQEGWFFRNKEDNGALSLDLDYQKMDRLTPVFSGATSNLNDEGSNYIKDLATTLAHTGTKPLFVLNPLTSDMQYQIAMLLEAKLLNLNIKRVEIGNEFYLSLTANQEKFSTSAQYADLVKAWKLEIKNYLGSDVLVSAVAANRDYNSLTNEWIHNNC